MRIRFIPALFAFAFLAGCFSPPPGSEDGQGPRIRLTLLNGYTRPVFDSTIPTTTPEELCGKVANFPGTPARLAISLSDPGGIDRVSVRALPGDILDASVVAAPDWTVTNRLEGSTDTTEVVFRRDGADRVLTSALVVLDVTSTLSGVGIVVNARDIAGNRTELYQVDVRALSDPAICRGGR